MLANEKETTFPLKSPLEWLSTWYLKARRATLRICYTSLDVCLAVSARRTLITCGCKTPKSKPNRCARWKISTWSKRRRSRADKFDTSWRTWFESSPSRIWATNRKTSSWVSSSTFSQLNWRLSMTGWQRSEIMSKTMRTAMKECRSSQIKTCYSI